MSLQYEPPAPPPDAARRTLPRGMADDGVTLTLRERPLLLWIMGAVFGGIGLVVLATRSPAPGPFVGALFTLIGAVMIVPVGVLVVTVDRRARVLTVERRSLARRFRAQVPFDDIRGIELRTSRSSSTDGSSQTLYRTVVTRVEGPEVPLRAYYESGAAAARRRKADLLAAAVGHERYPGAE